MLTQLNMLTLWDNSARLHPAPPDLTDLLSDAGDRPEAALLLHIQPRQAEKVVPILIRDFRGKMKATASGSCWAGQSGSRGSISSGRTGDVASRPASFATGDYRSSRCLARSDPGTHESTERSRGGLPGELSFSRRRYGPASRSAVKPLTAVLSDRDNDVRSGAAHVLEQIRPEAAEAVPALMTNLQALEAPVRASATLALGTIGPPPRKPGGRCWNVWSIPMNSFAKPLLCRWANRTASRRQCPPLPRLERFLCESARPAAIDSLSHIDHDSRTYTDPFSIRWMPGRTIWGFAFERWRGYMNWLPMKPSKPCPGC